MPLLLVVVVVVKVVVVLMPLMPLLQQQLQLLLLLLQGQFSILPLLLHALLLLLVAVAVVLTTETTVHLVLVRGGTVPYRHGQHLMMILDECHLTEDHGLFYPVRDAVGGQGGWGGGGYWGRAQGVGQTLPSVWHVRLLVMVLVLHEYG